MAGGWINALEAREIADANHPGNALVRSIMTDIQRNANEGYTYLYYHLENDDIHQKDRLKEILTDLGYKCEVKKSAFVEDELTLDISW